MTTPAPRTVLLTGAAGGVGALLRDRLPAYGYALRLFDIVPVPGDPDAIAADLLDNTALRAAVRGVDAVVHLAGISQEAPFADLLTSNIEGTYRLYEAARAEGVQRIVLASSNHAVGFTPRPAAPGVAVATTTPLRPDTLYGLSKCFGENLASLYADKYGIETVSLRIGSCCPRPRTVRMLATWLSPADCARLVHAALTAEEIHHAVVYGISANTRAWWDLSAGAALGYTPRDDAEIFAEQLIAELGEPLPDDPERTHIGGSFLTAEP
ncbi:NAD-dependent epimerase/dehydratase family protein [Streptomyces pathocidini]|uniref:NAD-dependent epimerase/dehydratase family protein n=1 Tax=Streptomyces pathocidini TaxID=1650571 RepID=A0ABW7UU99_9ACTN|nr:NAD(P)-dependent oxidoreductase [Streptomyces pathocidini]